MSPLDHIAAIPNFRGLDRSNIAVEPLDGLTNSSYRVTVGGERYVLRIPGPGTEHYIDRGREAHNTGLAADSGVGPEVLWHDNDGGTMLCRHIDSARPLGAKNFEDDELLKHAAQLLAHLHRCGAPFDGQLSPRGKFDHYLSLASPNRSEHADRLRGLLRESDSLRGAFERSTSAGDLSPCHVDPVPANFIASGTRLWLVDWEYAAMANPMWDLACLALEANLDRRQSEQLLRHYCSLPGSDLENRFGDHLLLVSAVGLAWTALQIAVRNPHADFASDYERRFNVIMSLLAAPA